jgi:hypothetical protein
MATGQLRGHVVLKQCVVVVECRVYNQNSTTGIYSEYDSN